MKSSVTQSGAVSPVRSSVNLGARETLAETEQAVAETLGGTIAHDKSFLSEKDGTKSASLWRTSSASTLDVAGANCTKC